MDEASPSPYSTGGGGYEYERMVGATYLAAMICGDAAPGVVDGTVTGVRFQQRNAGHLLDDLVVVFDKDGSAHRLSLQVKHGLPVGTSPKFMDIIGDCWRMFVGGEGITFDQSADRLGIVTSHVSENAAKHCLPVLKMARDSADSAAFWDRLKHGGHSKHRLEFARSIESTVTDSSGSEATDDAIWRFLRILHIIVLAMDDPGGADRNNVEGMCLRALAEPGEGEAAKLFDALRGVAADLAPAGGSVATAALRARLSAFDLAGHAKTGADIRRFNGHSQTAMDLIQRTIAGKVALDRVLLLAKLGDLAQSNAVTIVHGEPFAGKSALARLFVEKVPRSGAAIFLGTDCLGGGGSLGAFLTSQGVQGSLEDILETHGAAPHRYIIIDGLDRISYEPEKIQVVKGLLAAVSRYNAGAAAASPVAGVDTSWKIIATTRSMELEYVENAVKEWCGGRLPAVLEVGPLTDEEIDEVLRQLPQLGGDTLRLGGLLSLPGYLDMIAGWQPASLEGVQGAIGAGRLSDLFWKDAVLRLGGLRGGKGNGLAREKILVDMAKKAYRGLPTDLHDLDHEAVDGLLTDRLVRTDGNRLVFAHDVIEDYALARMIEWTEPRRPLFESAIRSRRLVRPLRICAAKMLEAGGSGDKWESLLEDCRLADSGYVWARECLLGVADSDGARSNLDAVSGALLRDGGRLLADLLAALPSAFVRASEDAIKDLRERGDAEPELHATRYKLPVDERFSPVLSFALDNIERVGDAAEAEFIRTAAMWSLRGRGRGLKRRIAEYAVQHADWLRGYGRILGQDGRKSDDVRCLIAAIVMYSSDAAPDLARKFLSDAPHIAHNEHFRRALVEKGGWIFLCKFLPDVAVDVLSRTMCTNSNDSGFLQAVPGTRDDGWTDRVSPREGPFYHFLSHHSEHGLELVQRLLNHTTEQWRRAQEVGDPLHPRRIPLPQTILLESGPVDVYGDEHAFEWCGYTRRAPNLVASALLALELWLDVQVARGKEPVPILFERVLRGTTSAAVVGVCCTVALRHMDKAAEAMLPILANPAFWIMNERRQEADVQAGIVPRVREEPVEERQTSTERHSSSIRHADERSTPVHLNAFVMWLLLVGPDRAREKMQEALAAFPDRIPVFFENDPSNENVMKTRQRYCEMLSKRGDKSNYVFLAASENSIRIAFDTERFHTSGEKRAEELWLAQKKALLFMMWSHTLIEQNKAEPWFTIASALEYAEQVVEDKFPPSPLEHYVDDAINGMANLVGAMIIHRWDEAVEMGVGDSCLKYLEDIAAAIDPRARDDSSYPYGADRAVARALPKYYLRCNCGRGAKTAILKFADAYNAEVLGLLMEGLCTLWDRDDGLVLECITRARRQSRSKKDRSGRPYTDWTGYAALLPALRGAPPAGDSTEGKIRRVVDDMLDDTIAAFKDLENGRGYGATHESFTTWCSEFFRTLGSYTAARPDLRGDILEKLLSHWEAAPQLLESFMRWTFFWGEAEGRDKDLLATWKHLLPAVIGSKILTGYRNRGTRRSIVGLLIFADPPSGSQGAKGLDILDEFAPEISSWCKALAGNRDAVEAIVSLLGSAPPALILSHGVGWLWQVLRPADMTGLSDATVKMLSQLLHKASTCKRPRGTLPDLSAKYEWLVDCLVVLNDPVAESLKDEGTNPYADARVRGRR